jgi:hypothetical protein
MIINIHEAPASNNDDLAKRVEELEQANEEITTALELLIKKLMSDQAASGALEPCDCGNPNCPKQAAYEAQQAQQAEAPNSVGGDSGSGGQYI